MNDQQGLVRRIERKLESTVEDAFARVFGGAVVPEELEAALRREAAAGVRALPGNHLLAPNDYVITLGPDDYRSATGDPDLTATAFARHLAAFISEQGWETYGDVVVRFQQSPSLRTGQVRARGAVSPEASPQPPTSDCPPQSDRASTAESGVPPMTDNPSYHGGQGQDRPGDEYYDPRAGQEPRGPYPPEPEPYQDARGGYPPRHPDQGGYPPHQQQAPQPGYNQGGYNQPGYNQGGYDQPAAGYNQGGYDQPAGGYDQPAGGYDQGGYPDQGYQQPPAGYAQPPAAQPAGYGDYPSPQGRHEDYRYPDAAPEQQQPYPQQGGYDQPAGGYDQGASYPRQDYPQQDYAQPDYAQPDYSRYPDAQGGYDYGQQPAAAGYDAGPAGYADAQGGYDYGQQPGGYDQAGAGYDAPGGYGQRGYSAPTTVTLQLDDGSGRTYQLHDGSNVVGRGQDAQFRLPDTGVSRRHLEIRWDGRVALLSDLNSTNGTTVNNAPVQEWQLADGDVIRLGHSEIVVRVH